MKTSGSSPILSWSSSSVAGGEMTASAAEEELKTGSEPSGIEPAGRQAGKPRSWRKLKIARNCKR